MRTQVDFLDTSKMEWKSLGPGLSNKILSRDPETTARTALTRASPAEGLQNQPKAHAHEVTEEIFITKGLMSFDSRTWFHPGGYVYHPAFYVHGFNSKVTEETIFVSRLSADLTFRYFEDTIDDFPYFIGDKPASRPLTIVASPWATMWRPVAQALGAVREFDFGSDPTSQAKSTLRRYAAGSQDPQTGMVPAGYIEEFFVHEGELVDQRGQVFSEGCFACLLQGSQQPRFKAHKDSLVYRSLFVA